ncbi:polysaccharide pyruvyl transferase family protein [Paenibacillus thiaminolyticus]|uniref:polysaccharide pyruvyl transferase family protein n=1 Tax=Paenibacillus thiaminolyticus TaxID=49283 RepID=UPI003D2C5A03
MGNFGDDVCLRTLQKRFDGHAVYPWLPQMSPDDTDAVIIGGGDLITLYSFNPYYFPAALRNHPTWVYSVSIVDAYPEETWPEDQVNRYRERIRRAQKAVFRDAHSLAIASRAGFHTYPTMAPDIAFGYQEPRFPVKRLSDRPTIGIVIFSLFLLPVRSDAPALPPVVGPRLPSRPHPRHQSSDQRLLRPRHVQSATPSHEGSRSPRLCRIGAAAHGAGCHL